METNKEAMELFSPSGCLTEEAMRSFSMAQLSENDRTQVKEHLSSCEFCSMAMEGISLFMAEKGETAFKNTLQNLSAELDTKLESAEITETQELPSRNTRVLWGVLSLVATVGMLIGLYLVIKLYVPDAYKKKQMAVNQNQTVYESLHLQAPPPADSVHPQDNNPWAISRFNAPVVAYDTIVQSDANNQDDSKYQNHITLGEEDFKVEEKQASGGVLKDAVSPKTVTKKLETTDLAVQSYSPNSAGAVQTVESKTKQYYRAKKSVSNAPELASKSVETMAMAEKEDTPIFTVVEEMPSYPGGEDARLKFIKENVEYPPSAKEQGISGTVYVTFVINEKGKIENVKVLRGIGGGCDEEALKVIQKMPRWIPGKQSGKAVKVQFTMPIKFTLN